MENQMERQIAKQVDSILQGEETGCISYPASLILVDSSDSEAIRGIAARSTSLPTLTALVPFGSAVLVSGGDDEAVLQLCLDICDAAGARCLYGSPRSSANELAQCYENLLDLWQQRFLYPGQQVLSETLTAAYSDALDFETKDTEPLFSSLRAGELDKARAVWKEIFEKIRTPALVTFVYTGTSSSISILCRVSWLEPLANASDLTIWKMWLNFTSPDAALSA